jgi:tRNA (adenine37-N6)-methyltransferase
MRGEIRLDMQVSAIGFVEARRPHAEDDYWGGEQACIQLTKNFAADALEGLGESTICRVVRVSGTRLFVAELDAIDGTPVLDLKPVMAEFLPREAVLQPAWSRELMRQYWLQRA